MHQLLEVLVLRVERCTGHQGNRAYHGDVRDLVDGNLIPLCSCLLLEKCNLLQPIAIGLVVPVGLGGSLDCTWYDESTRQVGSLVCFPSFGPVGGLSIGDFIRFQGGLLEDHRFRRFRKLPVRRFDVPLELLGRLRCERIHRHGWSFRVQ